MTAIKDVYLLCNFGACGNEFRAPPNLGTLPVPAVRREARKAGWTVTRSALGRVFDKDFCPRHPEGRESAEGGQEIAPITDSRPA